jgi:spore coat polysaccharide biosynthesis predicted glycosyltransferase SpsG
MNTLSPKKILFYVDGELESGWGHLRRSEALAYEAKARGWEVLFLDTGPRASQWLQERSWNVVAVSAETDASVLVIDSYLITSEMIAEYKKRYTYVVGFHDFGAIDERFDLVISSVLTGESTQAATTIIAGASYRTIPMSFLKHDTRLAETLRGLSSLSVLLLRPHLFHAI